MVALTVLHEAVKLCRIMHIFKRYLIVYSLERILIQWLFRMTIFARDSFGFRRASPAIEVYNICHRDGPVVGLHPLNEQELTLVSTPLFGRTSLFRFAATPANVSCQKGKDLWGSLRWGFSVRVPWDLGPTPKSIHCGISVQSLVHLQSL